MKLLGQVRELQRKMRSEISGLQRQINAIEREEEKVTVYQSDVN
jgi:hypothetical protein